MAKPTQLQNPANGSPSFAGYYTKAEDPGRAYHRNAYLFSCLQRQSPRSLVLTPVSKARDRKLPKSLRTAVECHTRRAESPL